jgi:hypothetical protein
LTLIAARTDESYELLLAAKEEELKTLTHELQLEQKRSASQLEEVYTLNPKPKP